MKTSQLLLIGSCWCSQLHAAGARIAAAYKEDTPELKESGSRIGKSKAGRGAAYRAELAAP